MKKSLIPLICVFVVFSFSSCIQSVPSLRSSDDETVMLHWLDMDQEGLVRKTMDEGNATDRDSLFSGNAIETFEQSPTKSVSSWKRGLRHGVTTEYFYNGRKRRVISYEKGERNGISKEFRITGELLAEESYSDGKLNGSKSEYHPNGTKIMEVEMRDGKPHGDATEWYEDGTKKSLTIYRHGLREGPSSEWYRTGQQKLGLFYQKDKQHGLRTIWYDNGKKRLTAQFVDDKMEGNSKGWFPNGQQQFDYNFRNNLEHGVCTEWSESGRKISELQFIDGQPVQDLLSGKSLKPIEQVDPPKISEPATEIEKVTPSVPATVESVASEIPASEKEASGTDEAKLTPEAAIPSVPEPTVDPVGNLSGDNISPPLPPTFDPFNISTDPTPSSELTKPGKPEPVTPPPPPPPVPAPTFDPFAIQGKTDGGNSAGDSPAVIDPPTDLPPPPPPEFDPFENKSPAPADPASSISPPPPAPTFNPFENEPESGPNSQVEKSSPDLDIPPPPPPPAPTFNPFESDPLPPAPPDISPKKNNQEAGSSNPFDSVNSESNETSVPLENIFNTPPPTSPPADGFNPFDLPSEN